MNMKSSNKETDTMTWSHEKEALFRNYAKKYATNKLTAKERKSYEILKVQRREHLRDEKQEKRMAKQDRKIAKLVSAYKKLMRKMKGFFP